MFRQGVSFAGQTVSNFDRHEEVVAFWEDMAGDELFQAVKVGCKAGCGEIFSGSGIAAG